jgi:hypothetical protein
MSQTQQSRLLGLPNELLYDIASRLDVADVFHLIQTNRQLNHHLEHTLYKYPPNHSVQHVVATSNISAFERFIAHGLVVEDYEIDDYPLIAHLAFESTSATFEMATMLFQAKLIDVRCWSYHGVGKRYTTVARDFASLMRRNGIASHSREEAKEKWRPVDGAAKYQMPWGWMWFVPRGGMESSVKLGGAANWIDGTGVVGGIFSIPPLLALLLSSFSYPFTVDILPKEARFQHIRVQDLPRAASSRPVKRRRQDRPLVPLSDRDQDFQFFGAPPGLMPPVNGSCAGVVPSPGQTGIMGPAASDDHAGIAGEAASDGGDE